MRRAPDPLVFILRYPELQMLPTEERKALYELISQLQDVNLQVEIGELWQRRGHYSYALSMFGGRFRFSSENYIHSDVFASKERSKQTTIDKLVKRLRTKQLQEVPEDDMMVIRVAIKKYIDWMEGEKEKLKEQKRIENEKLWETLQ